MPSVTVKVSPMTRKEDDHESVVGLNEISVLGGSHTDDQNEGCKK